MGSEASQCVKYVKLTPENHAVVKKIWSGIERNPQYHANVIFLSFCETYPQYTKYFTAEIDVPLTIDAHTSTKFLIIIETLGYLLLDFHNKPNDLGRLIGYVAMIHKDMDLGQPDMFNFGACLIDYLTLTFPNLMNAEYQNIFSKYIHNILDGVSEKIEDLKRNDPILLEADRKINETCVGRIFHKEKLIYGRKQDHWNERKRKWDERLEYWKSHACKKDEDQVRSSSTDDEVNSAPKSGTEEESSEFRGSAGRFLESYGITISKGHSSYGVRGPRLATLKTKRAGESHFEVVDATNLLNQLEERQKRNSRVSPRKIDSSARQRYRQRHSSHS